MTTDKVETGENSFVRQRLPWLIGGGGLLVYLVTLNHWISLPSLGTVAQTAGWLWQPEVGRPLTLLVLAPFRCLPDSWLPLALNLFTAVLASLVLVQLARSVALLRYDVVSDDPFRQGKSVSTHLSTPAAWMPPVLAALLCGLQLGFWENATSATGEMISLLCFAFAIRCLSEFRISGAQSWLYRCAGVYAAGMADNAMMVGYFPVLLATIIWVKGFGPFLELRFLLRLLGCGLAGLSLYLLLPALLSFSSSDGLDFGTTLKAQLRLQKHALLMFRSPPFRLLLLTALLPALLLAVRWRSHTVQFADDTRLGVFMVKATGHFVHGLFFITALWIALNPILTTGKVSTSPTMLVYYFVWALVAGYCAGYFLLFKTNRPPHRPAKLPAHALAVLIGLMSLVLLWRNLGEVRATNDPALHELARQLYDDLPDGESVVLSEDLRQLFLLRAELAGRGHGKDPILVESSALISPQYHQFMERRHATRWPDVPGTNRSERISAPDLTTWLSRCVERGPVVYLHPSAGFYMEPFVGVPNGFVYRLVPRANGERADAAHPAANFAANEQIWQQRWAGGLGALARQFADARQGATRWSRPPLKPLRLTVRYNATVSVLSATCSKSLNSWGVEARRSGHEQEATEWFRRAIELNPGNLAAQINLEYATRCQNGDGARLKVTWVKEQFPEVFGKYDGWWEVLSRDGAVDEPTYLLQTGRVLLATRNPRQATEAFARCAVLATNWLSPKLWLAHSHNLTRNFVPALEVTDALQADRQGLKGHGLAQLLFCRAASLRGLGRTNDAAALIEQYVSEYGAHSQVLAAAANLYAANSEFQRELDLREVLLERDPNNPESLVKKGLVELRLSRHEEAIATLTRALSIAPENGNARLLRAVACLRAGRLEASKADYLELLKQPDQSQNALFGLGTVAWRKNDTNAVMQYYHQYLSNNAAISPQFNLVTERLRQLAEE